MNYTHYEIKNMFKLPEGTNSLVRGDRVPDHGCGQQFEIYVTPEQKYIFIMRRWTGKKSGGEDVEDDPYVLLVKDLPNEHDGDEFTDEWIAPKTFDTYGYDQKLISFPTMGYLKAYGFPEWDENMEEWTGAYQNVYEKIKEYFK
jgi:hypothetical protein